MSRTIARRGMGQGQQRDGAEDGAGIFVVDGDEVGGAVAALNRSAAADTAR